MPSADLGAHVLINARFVHFLVIFCYYLFALACF